MIGRTSIRTSAKKRGAIHAIKMMTIATPIKIMNPQPRYIAVLLMGFLSSLFEEVLNQLPI
jgi:hypothetical protein